MDKLMEIEFDCDNFYGRSVGESGRWAEKNSSLSMLDRNEKLRRITDSAEAIEVNIIHF